MAILRDIIAQFAIQVDMRPLTELDKQINKVNKSLRTIGAYAGTGLAAAGAAMWKLTEYGSHANETFSALKATYKDDQEAVLQWANETGKIMNRSTFDLQESALKFGAFLGPVFKDAGTDEIAAMSEELSKLAIDLAAFYDTSDQDAVMRLFSGMSGETEAVRRLGIDISDTTLEDLNKNVNGDPRTMRALTLQEKASLRLQKIMIDTKDKQGQAVREAGEWAGQLKAAEARLKDLAVIYGRRLIPFAKTMLKYFRTTLEYAVRFYENLENIGSNLRAAAITMGMIGLGWVFQNREALKLVLQMYHLKFVQEGFYKSLLKSAAQVAAMAAAFLVIEDVVGFLRGHDSVFGDLLSAITGVQDPMSAIENKAQRIVTHFMNMVQLAKNLGSELLNYDAKLEMTWARMRGDTKTVKRLEAEKAARMRRGILDPDAPEDQRRGQRASAVQSGDVDAYIAAKRAGTDKQTAQQEFVAERAKVVAAAASLFKVVEAHPTTDNKTAANRYADMINLNAADIETGAITEAQFKAARPQGNVEIGNIIVNSNKADPVEVAKEVDKRLDERLREAAAAEGDEE